MAEPRQPSVEEILRDRNILTQKTKKAVQEYTTQKDKTTKENLTEIISDLFLEYGFNEFIKETLDKVPDLDLSNALNTSSIKRAAQDYELLKKITDRHHVNINAKYPGGKTLLHQPLSDLAYENLIKCGADPNIADNEGNKPLTKLIESNQREKLKIYHEHNREKLFEVDESGKRPIDKILQFLNPKNDPYINIAILKELGLTQEQTQKVGLEGGQYKQTQMEGIIGGISNRSVYERVASFRLQNALMENNFKAAAGIIKNSEHFSTKELTFKNDQSKIIQDLLKSENKEAIKVLEALIEKGFALDVTRFRGKRNFLHIAAEKSPQETFIRLLDMQPKLRTVTDSEGNTPLHLFAQRKNETLESIKEINKKFPDLQTKENKEKQTPLTLFFDTHNPNNDPKRNHELVKSLGLDPIKTLNETGTLAANLSTFDKIRTEFNLKSEIIAKAKKDDTDNLSDRNKRYINSKDRTGQGAIHYAAKLGYEQSARNLIANGADIDLKDNKGKTALHHAIEKKRSTVAKILIEKGADINLADNNGETALTLAAKAKGNDQELTTTILRKMDQDYTKNSLVIDKAIYSCNLEKFTEILKHIKFPVDYNPLDILAYKCKLKEDTYDYAKKIKFLVEKGIEPNIEGKEKTYPLDIIAKAHGVTHHNGTWNGIKSQLPTKTQEALKEAEKARKTEAEARRQKVTFNPDTQYDTENQNPNAPVMKNQNPDANPHLQKRPLGTTNPSSQTSHQDTVLRQRSNTGGSRELGG